ncbi:MAG: beta-lactamase family protein, partial [Kordiimonadaceae bacterium]|nr:beta-lactamase family protein [Kordiimonadaceae bacterium]
MKYIIQTFLLLLLTSQVVQAQDLPQDFDEMVVADMEKWHAPGLGLAIVKDGKTILTKGYGVKSFETNDPVNENTLFQAGSTTKAFVAMSLAMLVDEGKVNWDDPIIKHIPEFKMKNK